MKSIMEEASSIFKAIENGWLKAGKPKEFSIKVFEEPERNFIGIITKSAKIGIFFEDAPQPKIQEQAPKRKQPVATQEARPKAVARPLENKQPKENIEKPSKKAPIFNLEPKEETPVAATTNKALQPVWTDNMLENIQKWVTEILETTGINANFQVTTQNFYLKINFDKSIYEDKNRERQLFSSLSTLLLQMLKHRYRRPLKGYKIILSCG